MLFLKYVNHYHKDIYANPGPDHWAFLRKKNTEINQASNDESILHRVNTVDEKHHAWPFMLPEKVINNKWLQYYSQ